MADPDDVIVQWVDGGREARSPPNPTYPQGVRVVLASTDGMPACKIDLPYPAPRCGAWHVTCQRCGMSVAVTAAGRPDDPKELVMPCKVTMQ